MTTKKPTDTRLARIQIIGSILTVLGLGLFVYFVYEAGIGEIWEGISRLGWGFLLIIGLYALKLSVRAYAWTLSIEKPYSLSFFNALRAVIMGEALSAMIPLGILISGTAKAFAVRKQLPLVVGLSSIAVENLFYSLATAILIFCGGTAFVISFAPAGGLAAANYALLGIIPVLIVVGFLAIVYEWRVASWLAEWLYGKGLATRLLHNGRAEVRRFEDLIYGFYRNEPHRFLPLILLQAAFHGLGILEVWIILQAISDVAISFGAAFLLEAVNRTILVIFKLIPFLVGVDEAGARFVTDSLGIGASIGVTLAIIRKGRVLFWTGLGIFLIVRSGLSLREVTATTLKTENVEA
jgi:hypothetical protein